MFCPQCRVEYRPGFTHCSDCHIELVDYLPPEVIDDDERDGTEDSDYVVVATVPSELQQGQIRSFLEAHGIPSQIRSESVWRVYGLTGGVAAVEILVPQEFAITASELLAKAERGELKIDAADGESSMPDETSS